MYRNFSFRVPDIIRVAQLASGHTVLLMKSLILHCDIFKRNSVSLLTQIQLFWIYCFRDLDEFSKEIFTRFNQENFHFWRFLCHFWIEIFHRRLSKLLSIVQWIFTLRVAPRHHTFITNVFKLIILPQNLSFWRNLIYLKLSQWAIKYFIIGTMCPLVYPLENWIRNYVICMIKNKTKISNL